MCGAPQKRSLFTIALVLTAVLAPHVARADLDTVFAQAKAHEVGAVFDDGILRYSRDEKTLYAPASITKIFIVGLSLETLGAGFRFQTRLRFERPQPDQAENLTLIASGDPTVGVPEFEKQTGTSIFEQFAASLKRAGIRSVLGSIQVVAESPRWTASEIRPASWSKSHLSYCYGARVSAAMIDGNCVSGRPISSGDSIWIARMKAALKKEGISLDKKRLKFSLKAHPATETLTAYSVALENILKPFAKESINIFGEAILLQVGAEISRSRGTAIRASALERLGSFIHEMTPEYASEIILDDGCGLSSKNRSSARATHAYLERAQKMRWFQPFVSSLAIGGVDGTLGSRFRGDDVRGRIFAKTGTLQNVAALAGYIADKNDSTKILDTFVVFGSGNVSRLRDLIDRAVETRAATDSR